MTLDKLIVTVVDMWAIGFVFWFFLLKREKQVVASDSIDIIVDGGYSPSTIIVKKGQTIKLNFLRKDPSSCLEEVVLGDFKTRKYLPLHKKITVEIKPQTEGEFPFACGMNMYHGKLIIK